MKSKYKLIDEIRNIKNQLNKKLDNLLSEVEQSIQLERDHLQVDIEELINMVFRDLRLKSFIIYHESIPTLEIIKMSAIGDRKYIIVEHYDEYTTTNTRNDMELSEYIKENRYIFFNEFKRRKYANN